MIAGIATLIYLTDEPSKAGWLSPEEIAALKADLERDTASLGSREQGVLRPPRTITESRYGTCGSEAQVVRIPDRGEHSYPGWDDR